MGTDSRLFNSNFITANSDKNEFAYFKGCIMNTRLSRRYKLARRVAIILAAAPLFQLSQCHTGVNQVLATTANNAPATVFQVLNGIFLAPLYALIGGSSTGQGTGGTGSNSTF